ncbi:MAG: hypothetical protein BWY19_00778 [bacterium ADurb.Bin212]|nr:MAG: hypothetical protein BWY19_00778 [bacterium ADurb.Bin212]
MDLQEEQRTRVGLTDAVQKLYSWQTNYTGCFTDLLYDLFLKADAENYRKLCDSYPFHGIIFAQWRSADCSDLFFEKNGIKKGE